MSAISDRAFAEVAANLAEWRRGERAAHATALNAFPVTCDTFLLSEACRLAAVEFLRAVEEHTGEEIGLEHPLIGHIWGVAGTAFDQGRISFSLEQEGVIGTWNALRAEMGKVDEAQEDRIARCFLRLHRLARFKAWYDTTAARRHGERTSELLKAAVAAFFKVADVLEPTGLPVLFRPFLDALQEAGDEFDLLLGAVRADANADTAIEV